MGRIHRLLGKQLSILYTIFAIVIAHRTCLYRVAQSELRIKRKYRNNIGIRKMLSDALPDYLFKSTEPAFAYRISYIGDIL